MKGSDVSDRKLILGEPKSAKESEVAFMPEKIAKRLPDYMLQESLSLKNKSCRFVIPLPGQGYNFSNKRHSAT